jgi:hypothetical protein
MIWKVTIDLSLDERICGSFTFFNCVIKSLDEVRTGDVVLFWRTLNKQIRTPVVGVQ